MTSQRHGEFLSQVFFKGRNRFFFSFGSMLMEEALRALNLTGPAASEDSNRSSNGDLLGNYREIGATMRGNIALF